ncbi:MAG: flagellar basal body-associated FliL family protein [Lautropia sp.]
MAAKPESKAGDEKAEGKKRGKGLIIAIVAVVLAAGGGGAWFMTRPNGDDHEAPPKKVETIFMNLEPFTVNLADEGGDRLAQVGIVLQFGNKEAQEALTKQLPAVRNGLLLLISSQQSKTLLSLDGKLALADEIALRTGVAIGWNPEEPEEDEEEVKPTKKAGTATKKKKKVRREPEPNPITAVHFSQLLIQ